MGAVKTSCVSFQFDTGIFTSPWSACHYGYLPAGQGLRQFISQNKIFNVVWIRLRVANLICSPQT